MSSLVDELRKEYLRVEELADGTIVALGELLYTRAIHIDCDRWGWRQRFCFEDRAEAARQFDQLVRGEIEEPHDYTARR